MTLRNLFRVFFLDGFSVFGVAILVLYGSEALTGASMMNFHHRWGGYAVLISAFVVAYRVRMARKAGA